MTDNVRKSRSEEGLTSQQILLDISQTSVNCAISVGESFVHASRNIDDERKTRKVCWREQTRARRRAEKKVSKGFCPVILLNDLASLRFVRRKGENVNNLGRVDLKVGLVGKVYQHFQNLGSLGGERARLQYTNQT